MKSDREIANDILAHALNDNLKAANSILQAAIRVRRKYAFRAHSAKYLMFVFFITALCLGIDVLDGDIIDKL